MFKTIPTIIATVMFTTIIPIITVSTLILTPIYGYSAISENSDWELSSGHEKEVLSSDQIHQALLHDVQSVKDMLQSSSHDDPALEDPIHLAVLPALGVVPPAIQWIAVSIGAGCAAGVGGAVVLEGFKEEKEALAAQREMGLPVKGTEGAAKAFVGAAMALGGTGEVLVGTVTSAKAMAEATAIRGAALGGAVLSAVACAKGTYYLLFE